MSVYRQVDIQFHMEDEQIKALLRGDQMSQPQRDVIDAVLRKYCLETFFYMKPIKEDGE